jgi:23S rRNA-intervening sequence protein
LAKTNGAHLKDFRELKVWEKAHEMVLQSYRLTETFPKHELFGMAGLIRRCSASIAANIAEGCGRPGNTERIDSCKLPADLPASSNITSCWRGTWATSPRRITCRRKGSWSK